MNKQTCPSCLVPYIEHLGLIGTCANLIQTKKEFQDFVMELVEMEVITQSRACEVLHCKIQDLRGYYVMYEERRAGE